MKPFLKEHSYCQTAPSTHLSNIQTPTVDTKGPTLYLVFLVIGQCLTSSSVQIYRTNIAESTMTMTLIRKTRYNAPPLV
jgi:hypothetical protein